MKTIVVYGETIRQARKFYPARQGVKVQYKIHGEEAHGDEEASEVLFASEKPKPKKKK